MNSSSEEDNAYIFDCNSRRFGDDQVDTLEGEMPTVVRVLPGASDTSMDAETKAVNNLTTAASQMETQNCKEDEMIADGDKFGKVYVEILCDDSECRAKLVVKIFEENNVAANAIDSDVDNTVIVPTCEKSGLPQAQCGNHMNNNK